MDELQGKLALVPQSGHAALDGRLLLLPACRPRPWFDVPCFSHFFLTISRAPPATPPPCSQSDYEASARFVIRAEEGTARERRHQSASTRSVVDLVVLAMYGGGERLLAAGAMVAHMRVVVAHR